MEYGPYEQITAEKRGPALIVTLHRPDRMNAYTYLMRQEISDAIDKADVDDDVRGVVFTGHGRAYCAGADLELGADTFNAARHKDARPELAGTEAFSDMPDDFRDDGGKLVLRLYRSKKPLIAAVNGAAVGVGATMTLPMDVRICSERAKFGFVFLRRGITPDGCSTWFLPRVVGVDRALEWCVTGRIFGPDEAAAAGLVREVVPPERLLPRALEIVDEIARNTPAVAVAVTRAMLWSMQSVATPEEAHVYESRSLYWTGQSADVREGVTAFLEKREPKFGMRVSTDIPAELLPPYPPLD
jgi:enoyl-CoA hydratase/carnithine racemase